MEKDISGIDLIDEAFEKGNKDISFGRKGIIDA